MNFTSTTVQDWKDELARMTFMPTIQVYVNDDFTYGLILGLTAKVENSFRPGQTVDVMSRESVSRLEMQTISKEEIPRRIKNFVQRWWLHEFDEWVRYDGWLMDDPHKGQPGHQDRQLLPAKARGYSSEMFWRDEMDGPELDLAPLKYDLSRYRIPLGSIKITEA